MPNIIEQQEQIMGLSREALVNYAQNPSGALPLYLVLERIRDLTQQEKKYLASQDQPQGTIFDQSLAEASPSPQGIGELQPQMPIGASGGAMPPSNAMQQPQMPPEMMSAQMASAAPQPQMMAARGGRMPYRRMAGGGPIPGSIMEDASKFSPESLYDVGPMQQSAMANATNMGIPSVLPMAGGGVVKMGLGGYLTRKEGWVPDRYQDEGKGIDSLDYSQIGWDALTATEAAALAMMLAPEPTSTVAGGALKAGTTLVRAVPKGIQFAKTIPSRVKALPDQVSDYLAREEVAKHQLGKRLTALLGIGAIEGSRRIGNAPAENESPTTSDQSSIDFLEERGYASGGIVRMQNGLQVPRSEDDNFVSMADIGRRLQNYYQDNPDEEVDPDHVEQIQAFQSNQAFMGRPIGSAIQEYMDKELPGIGQGVSSYENLVNNLESLNQATPEAEEVIGAPDVPVLTTGEVTPDAVGVREIPGLSDLVTPDQDTELKTARERLTGLMGQEVEPYDPTELLLKSQERADQRAINQALINFGAGIARGDAASGLEKAGESVASIKDRQELLEQQLQTRRGEAQVQAQKDQIARDIAIAEADIGAIESDKDYQDKLIARQIQYEGLLLDARTADNDALVKQFTAQLAANKFLQDQSEFDRTLAANFIEQEQLNYRQQLATLTRAFEGVQSEILQRSKLAKEDGTIPTWSEVQAELEAARKSIFGQIVALKDQGTGWKPSEELRNIGGVSLVQGDDGVYRIGN